MTPFVELEARKSCCRPGWHTRMLGRMGGRIGVATLAMRARLWTAAAWIAHDVRDRHPGCAMEPVELPPLRDVRHGRFRGLEELAPTPRQAAQAREGGT